MTEDYSAPVKVKRPIGISILAILLGVYAALVLISILYVAAHPEVARRWMAKGDAYDIAADIVVFSPLRIFLAAVLSTGLWRLKDWARKGVIFFAAMGLVRSVSIALPSLFSDSPNNTVSRASVIRIMLMIGVAVYMIQTGVVRAFEKQSALESEPLLSREPRE